MKLIAIKISFFISLFSYSQDLYIYKDTVNNFSIGIPQGWQYGKMKDYPTIKLAAYQIIPDSANKSKENFNINIFNSSNSNLETVYSNLIAGISKAKNFKIVDSGSVNINGSNYKWLIETHENTISPIRMFNYDFITLKDKKCYILTLVAVADSFEQYKPLFEKIAFSLKI